MMLCGVPIHVSPLATVTRCRVEPWPIRKRRRRWRVVKREEPGAYWMGGVLLVHPGVIAKIQQAGVVR